MSRELCPFLNGFAAIFGSRIPCIIGTNERNPLLAWLQPTTATADDQGYIGRVRYGVVHSNHKYGNKREVTSGFLEAG